MAAEGPPEKGKRAARKETDRPGPGPKGPKARAGGSTPEGADTHEIAVQPPPHSRHHFKAADRWRILCKPAAGFQGALYSSSAVRRCDVPPDYVDLLIEFHKYASRRGFLREIDR